MKLESKILVIIGIALIITGLLLPLISKYNFLGRLPGDINIDRGDFKFYFPLTSSILISAILSLVIYFLVKK